MTSIALSPQIARANVKSNVILGFNFGLRSTPEMVASIERGELPQCISRKGLPTDWSIDINSHNGYRSVSVPTFAYSGSYVLTAEQFRMVADWLDRVAPGWETMSDAVSIQDAESQRELDRADGILDEAWRSGPGRDAL